MHWYNPKTMCVEDALTPLTDEEALEMLLSVHMGFLSGLEAQSELSELLDELYYKGLM